MAEYFNGKTLDKIINNIKAAGPTFEADAQVATVAAGQHRAAAERYKTQAGSNPDSGLRSMINDLEAKAKAAERMARRSTRRARIADSGRLLATDEDLRDPDWMKMNQDLFVDAQAAGLLQRKDA
jgi:hypothetical protein